MQNGHQVLDGAYNGKECIQKLQKFKNIPDFIILDYQMPVMNGLETLKELKKRKINVKVIIISADSSIENEALARGAVSFFEKPVDIQNLLEILNDIFLVKSGK